MVHIPLNVPITLATLIRFLVAWLVSGAIIYIAVKLYPGKQENETFGAALAAALLGEVIYTFFHIVPIPFTSLIALIVWLYAIKKIFNVGWIGAAVIALIVYVLSLLVAMLGIPKLL